MNWDRLVVKSMAGVQWAMLALIVVILGLAIYELGVILVRGAMGLPDPPDMGKRS